jgi:hypothetical protein
MMGFSTLSFISMVIVVSAHALPSLLSASALDQPAPFYPIGTSNRTNAIMERSLAGCSRSMGKWGIFAGFGSKPLLLQLLKFSQKQRVVAGTFEQQLEC